MANCPSCNALLSQGEDLLFHSVLDCRGCKKPIFISASGPMIHRHHKPVEEDGSLLTLGMTGMRNGKKFELIGRVQYVFNTGLENMWYLRFADGTDGWLSEHFFTYAIALEVSPLGLAELPKKMLDYTTFHGKKYRLSTIKAKFFARWEGFLPYNPAEEANFTCYEMQSFDELFWATVTHYNDGKKILHLAEIIELETLHLLETVA